uniref:Uncharacterized protein n=1 Tax=Vibrio vulnificus TaxID=672 RepID=A0A6S4Q1C2_VIBVL|nr:conserved hypothetical protein [Vibrio vulnificus]
MQTLQILSGLSMPIRRQLKLVFISTRLIKKSPNKAFKWDSCRVAFLVCGEFWW